MVGVYFIYDYVGECVVTDFFKSKNDKVAMVGFQSFINDCKTKGLSGKNYCLYKIGLFDDDNLKFVTTGSDVVVRGDDVHDKLVAFGVLTDDIEEVTEQTDTVILDNGEL